MFKGKESIFGSSESRLNCYLSALSITAIGAVPIARPTDIKHRKVNLKSFKELTQYLKWDGVVCLYPEGTINRKPEKQNLAPLISSNATFKLAKNNNALILPTSIVWIPKELKLKHRVAVFFDKPINPENMDVDNIVNLWLDKVNANIDYMNAVIERLNKIEAEKGDEDQKNENKEKVLEEFKNMMKLISHEELIKS